jgi:hypothetical protein
MTDTILFDEGGVSVTSARLVVHGQPYLVRSITAVRADIMKPDRVMPALIALAGLALAIYGGFVTSGMAMVLGVMLIVVGGVIGWRFQSVRHRVWVTSAAGEVEALSHDSADFVHRVVAALNAAIEMVPEPAPESTRKAARAERGA